MDFLRAAGVVSMLTFFSRVLGLVRDMVTTAFLSAFYTDALFLAWTIPNMFRKLFGEGALSAAFIPAFARVRQRESAQALREFASSVITALFLILVVIVALLLLLSWLLPDAWILPLFQGDARSMEETLLLGRILLPYMIIVCVIAQFQGILNSCGVFSIPALAPMILNFIWIAAAAAAFFFLPDGANSGDGIMSGRALVICCAILGGGFVQAALFLPSLGKRSMIPKPCFRFKDKAFREVMARMIPMALALSAVQVNILVDRMVVRMYVPGDGGVTHLFLGNRLMQFPLGLIGIALTTVVFPLLARLSSEGDRKGVRDNLSTAIRINLFLSIPAMAGLIVLAEPIVSLFFEREAFTAADTMGTSAALVGYSVGIPFLSLVMLLTRAFYVVDRWKTPLYTAASLVLLNVVLDFALVHPLGETGVALATSITTFVQAGLLFLFLRRLLGRLGGFAILSGAIRSAALTILLCLSVLWLLDILGADDGKKGLLFQIVCVALPMGAGLLVYLVPARLVCPSEFRCIADAFRGRTGDGKEKLP